MFRSVQAWQQDWQVSWTTSEEPSPQSPHKTLLSLIGKTWGISWMQRLEISGYQPRKMPMKPPRPLASSPTSSGMRRNLTTGQPEITLWQKCLFKRLSLHKSFSFYMHRTLSGGCSCWSWHRDKKRTTSFEPSLLPPRFSPQKWTTCGWWEKTR